MSNPYDELVRDEPATSENPYDRLVADEQDDALRSAAEFAKDRDPSKYAEVVDLETRTGLPAELIEDNLDLVRREASASSFDASRFRRESPIVAEWFKDPSNHAIARDDAANLSTWEWMFGGWLPLPATLGAGSERRKNLKGAVQTAFERGERDTQLGRTGWNQLRGKATDAELAHADRLEALPETYLGDKGYFSGAVLGAARMLPYSIGTLKYGGAGAILGAAGGALVGELAGPEAIPAGAAAGAKIGGSLFAFGYVAQQEAGSAYREFLGYRGPDGEALDPAVAKYAALGVGAINGGLEFAGDMIQFKNLPGGRAMLRGYGKRAVQRALASPTFVSVLKDIAIRYGENVTAETAEEAAQQVATAAVRELQIEAQGIDPEGRNARLRKDLTEVVDAGAQAFQAMTVMGLSGPIGSVMEQSAAIHAGRKNKALMEGIGKAQSKLRERLPEKHGEIVQKIADASNAGTLFTDVDAWDTYWQSVGVDPRAVHAELTGSVEGYDEARNRGGEVATPTGAWSAKLAATEHHAPLIEDTSAFPGAMTPRELAEFEKDPEKALASMQEEFKKAMKGIEKEEPGDFENKLVDDFIADAVKSGIAPEVARKSAAPLQAMIRVAVGRFNKHAEAEGRTLVTSQDLFGGTKLTVQPGEEGRTGVALEQRTLYQSEGGRQAAEDTLTRVAEAARVQYRPPAQFQLTSEAIPSEETSLGKWLVAQPRAVQEEFTGNVGIDLEQDILSGVLRQVATGEEFEAVQKGIERSAGAYAGTVRPNLITSFLFPGMPEEKQAMLASHTAALIAWARDQDAVPWFRAKNGLADDPKATKGVHLTFGENLTPEKQRALLDRMTEVLGEGAGYTQVAPNRVAVLNYRSAKGVPFGVSDEEFGRAMDALVEEKGLGITQTEAFGAQTDYVGRPSEAQLDEIASGSPGLADLLAGLRDRREGVRAEARQFARSHGAEVSFDRPGEPESRPSALAAREPIVGPFSASETATRANQALDTLGEGLPLSGAAGGLPATTQEGARLVAKAFVDDFRAQGYINLKGRKVKTPAQLAALCRIFRDPRFETLRIFWVKGDTVLAHEAYTSRMPEGVSIVPWSEAFGQKSDEYLQSIAQRGKALGADGYWLVHNHPSGQAEASNDDKNFTPWLSSRIPGFKGHVVIDHREFASLNANGDSIDRIKMPGAPTPDPLFPGMEKHPEVLGGPTIHTPDMFAEWAARALSIAPKEDGWILVAYLSTQHEIRAVEHVPQALFLDDRAFPAYVRDRLPDYAASVVMSYMTVERGTPMADAAVDYVRKGTLLDVVSDGPGHPSAMVAGGRAEAGYWHGLYYPEGKQSIPLRRHERLYQAARGYIDIGVAGTGPRPFRIGILENANLSTLLHETGHFYLEMISDLAARVDAPQDFKDDFAAIRSWLGAEAGTAFTTEQHEQFARGFETYLFEGKAPSLELAGVFARFREWLRQVYKTIRALDVNLTGEVRGVFDRMFASEQEIAQAETLAHAALLFENAEDAGMTTAQFAAYREQAQRVHDEAVTQLLARKMREIQRERKAEHKEEKALVEAEVEHKLNAQPVYRVLSYLRRGTEPDGSALPAGLVQARLDQGSLEALLHGQVEDLGKTLRKKFAFAYVGEGGIHPDVAAEMFGLTSGDEMVKAILAAPGRSEAIKQQVEEEMRRRHPEPEAAIAEGDAAAAALHVERRGEVFLTELKQLSKQSGIPVAPSSAVLREFARRTIARKPLKDLDLGVYRRSDLKAAKDAEKAVAKKDLPAALEAKRRQTVNHFLYVEAIKAREDGDSSASYLDRMGKKPARAKLGKAGHTYLDQVDALLDRFGFRPMSGPAIARKETLAAFIESERKAGRDPVISAALLDETYRKNYRELTIEELRALRDAVKNIERMADLKNDLLVAGKTRDLETFKAEALSTLRDSIPDPGKLKIGGDQKTIVERVAALGMSFDAGLVKMEQLALDMDGGDPNGPFAQILVHALADAQAAYHDETLAISKLILKALEDMPEELKVRLAADARYIPSIGRSLTMSQIYAAALNTGNASNLQKMTEGFQGEYEGMTPWSSTTLDEILGNLTSEDWDRVQEVWDSIETLWPKIVDLERRRTGLAPPKIERQAFTRFGKRYEGGYYPVVFDPAFSRAGRAQEAGLFEAGHVRAVTPHGHVIERIEEFARPLLLDLMILPHHIDQVLHDLTHREALLEAWRFMTDEEVANTVRYRLGKLRYDAILERLRKVANARGNESAVVAQGIGRAMAYARTALTAAVMGYKASVFMQNFSNVGPAISEIGVRWFTAGLAEYAARRTEAVAWVQSLSGEMRHRAKNTDVDLARELKKIEGKHGLTSEIRRFGYYANIYTDLAIAYPAWIGSFKKALSQGRSQEEAIRIADSTVRVNLGAAGTKDLAAIQDASGYQYVTMFYSWFNVAYNAQRHIARPLRYSRGEAARIRSALPKFLARTFFAFVIPATVGEWLAGRGPSGDDDEGLAEWILTKIALYYAGLIPVFGGVGNAIAKGDARFSPLVTMIQAPADTIRKTWGAVQGETEATDAMLSGLKTAAIALGLPEAQAEITFGYIHDLWTGEAEPEGVSDFGHDLFYRRKKAS